MEKPQLHKLPHTDLLGLPANISITMSIGQKWDAYLDGVYKAGGVIVELDDAERIVALYQAEPEAFGL